MWEQFGRYHVCIDRKIGHIFPKNKDGKSVPVRIDVTSLILKHDCGNTMTIKRYLHRGRWYWSDSRYKHGGCHQSHVLNEVAAMLFNGCKDSAREFLMVRIMGIPLSAVA